MNQCTFKYRKLSVNQKERSLKLIHQNFTYSTFYFLSYYQLNIIIFLIETLPFHSAVRRDGLEGSCRKLWWCVGLSGFQHVPYSEGMGAMQNRFVD